MRVLGHGRRHRGRSRSDVDREDLDVGDLRNARTMSTGSVLERRRETRATDVEFDPLVAVPCSLDDLPGDLDVASVPLEAKRTSQLYPSNVKIQ